MTRPRSDSYHRRDAVPCPACRGRARVRCSWCLGAGCGECEDGTVECEDCEGVGMVGEGLAKEISDEE